MGGRQGQWVECWGCLGGDIARYTVVFRDNDVVFYNKELGITETYVDVGSILHNASHIQGQKIIRILPEWYII